MSQIYCLLHFFLKTLTFMLIHTNTDKRAQKMNEKSTLTKLDLKSNLQGSYKFGNKCRGKKLLQIVIHQP